MSFHARDYTARHHVTRRTRSPYDGVLKEVQHDVLSRHPDWRLALAKLEDAPFKIPHDFAHRGMRPYARSA